MKKIAYVFVCFAFLACARTVTVDNYTTVIYYKKSIQQLESIITQTANELGWKTQRIGDGHLLAHYREEGNMTVNIYFNETSYSITYADSKGLSYDPNTHEIDKAYNKHTKELNKELRDSIHQ